MNVKSILGSVFAASASLLPISCSKHDAADCRRTRENLLEEIMREKPSIELDNIKYNISMSDAEVAEMQRCIDSVVFRDMIKGSRLLNDSDFIEDYNLTIAKTTTPTLYRSFDEHHETDLKKTGKMAEKLTVKELKTLTDNPVFPENGGNGYSGTGRQYLLDSIYHHRLFEKYNLLDKKGLKKFNALCRKVRP